MKFKRKKIKKPILTEIEMYNPKDYGIDPDVESKCFTEQAFCPICGKESLKWEGVIYYPEDNFYEHLNASNGDTRYLVLSGCEPDCATEMENLTTFRKNGTWFFIDDDFDLKISKNEIIFIHADYTSENEFITFKKSKITKALFKNPWILHKLVKDFENKYNRYVKRGDGDQPYLGICSKECCKELLLTLLRRYNESSVD